MWDPLIFARFLEFYSKIPHFLDLGSGRYGRLSLPHEIVYWRTFDEDRSVTWKLQRICVLDDGYSPKYVVPAIRFLFFSTELREVYLPQPTHIFSFSHNISTRCDLYRKRTTKTSSPHPFTSETPISTLLRRLILTSVWTCKPVSGVALQNHIFARLSRNWGRSSKRMVIPWWEKFYAPENDICSVLLANNFTSMGYLHWEGHAIVVMWAWKHRLARCSPKSTQFTTRRRDPHSSIILRFHVPTPLFGVEGTCKVSQPSVVGNWQKKDAILHVVFCRVNHFSWYQSMFMGGEYVTPPPSTIAQLHLLAELDGEVGFARQQPPMTTHPTTTYPLIHEFPHQTGIYPRRPHHHRSMKLSWGLEKTAGKGAPKCVFFNSLIDTHLYIDKWPT